MLECSGQSGRGVSGDKQGTCLPSRCRRRFLQAGVRLAGWMGMWKSLEEGKLELSVPEGKRKLSLW